MKIGYARVSTDDQNLENQTKQLNAYGCDQIFEDKLSGAKNDREGLLDAVKYLREGDKLVVTKLDRLGRDLLHLQLICKDLEAKGCGLILLDQNIDTSTSAGRAFFQMLGVFAEFELNIRKERCAVGVARKKASGKPYHNKKRKHSVNVQEVKKAYQTIQNVSELANLFKTSRQTIYRAIQA